MKNEKYVSRRDFVQASTLILSTAAVGSLTKNIFAEEGDLSQLMLSVGLITDIHYADKNSRGTRFYRDALMKMEASVKYFNKVKPTFVVELGDLIDSAKDLKTEVEHLKIIEAAYAKVKCPRHYVLGNHCVHSLTKDEFYEHTGMDQGYKSFDQADIHFVILDACHRSKDGADYGRGNFVWTDSFIPQKQLDWLKKDLAGTKLPTVVFAHQRIDGVAHKAELVKNAKEVRAILEGGNVLAVFQGHSHENVHAQIRGIHYLTLEATVEKGGLKNKAFSLLKIYKDGSLAIEGFGQHVDYKKLTSLTVG